MDTLRCGITLLGPLKPHIIPCHIPLATLRCRGGGYNPHIFVPYSMLIWKMVWWLWCSKRTRENTTKRDTMGKSAFLFWTPNCSPSQWKHSYNRALLKPAIFAGVSFCTCQSKKRNGVSCREITKGLPEGLNFTSNLYAQSFHKEIRQLQIISLACPILWTKGFQCKHKK